MSANDSYRELMRYLHRAALLNDRIGERLFTSRIGVGRSMFLVLHTIAEAGKGGVVAQQWIADQLSLTKGAVSRHVATAERAGWLRIEPSPVSRRENALVLTPSGRKLLARGRALQRDLDGLSDEVLDAADVAATVRTLRAICDILEKQERQ